MKKIIALLLAVLLSAGVLIGCTPAGNGNTADTSADVSTETDAVSAEPDATSAEPESSENNTVEVVPSGTIRILAIGNSFSTDCMQYLWQMMKEAGYDSVILGNLYYGGCTLTQHLTFAKGDQPQYTYYKNTSGTWNKTAGYKMSTALADEKWDIITFQQSSKTSGVSSSYGKILKDIVDYVAGRVDLSVRFIWNMTWAYQSDSTHSSFPTYDKNQLKMYNMIVDCVENQVMKDSRFVGIIPAGTAIQNARTSFMGDHLTRDGYHMDYYIGRYIVGLTWLAAISGVSVDKVRFNPSTAKINDDMMRAAKEAVTNAIKEPLKITNSTVTAGTMADGQIPVDPTVVLDPADSYEADKAVAASNEVDLEKYTLLSWKYLENTYWNSTSKAGTTTPGSTVSTYHQNICTDKKYSVKNEVPVGSLVFCDAGWQYRLEIYTEENAKYSGTRPAMSSAQFFTLTEEFLNGCNYIAWNVASDPKSDISAIYAQAAAHIRVYVPKA